MENALKIFKNNAAVAIFCIALSVWIIVNNNLNKLLFTTKKAVIDNDILYQSEENHEENTISYAELISTIMNGLDYDIQVNDITISAKDFNYLQFNYNCIPNKRYKQQVVYSENGTIFRILYKSE